MAFKNQKKIFLAKVNEEPSGETEDVSSDEPNDEAPAEVDENNNYVTRNATHDSKYHEDPNEAEHPALSVDPSEMTQQEASATEGVYEINTGMYQNQSQKGLRSPYELTVPPPTAGRSKSKTLHSSSKRSRTAEPTVKKSKTEIRRATPKSTKRSPSQQSAKISSKTVKTRHYSGQLNTKRSRSVSPDKLISGRRVIKLARICVLANCGDHSECPLRKGLKASGMPFEDFEC